MATSSAVIIGIHGLGNKPSDPPHGNDWKKAILEGLARNHGLVLQERDLLFDLAYWRPWNYPQPLDPDDEPYVPEAGDGPLRNYRQNWPDVLLSGKLDRLAQPLDWAKEHFGIGEVADAFLRRRLEDLGLYYGDAAKRQHLRDLLAQKLRAHAGKRIMLVAHSMGTIVAYDVLRVLGNQDPDLEIAHLVTLGSPLGLPHVLHKIREEHGSLRTPSIVAQWSNFADRRDWVAVDANLANDYDANDRDVRVTDRLVLNTYLVPPAGRPNPHKIWGYLRAPEVSEVIKSFLREPSRTTAS